MMMEHRSGRRTRAADVSPLAVAPTDRFGNATGRCVFGFIKLLLAVNEAPSGGRFGVICNRTFLEVFN